MAADAQLAMVGDKPTGRDHPIVLFDGVCNLCNGAVRFIVASDPKGVFRFASLQSEEGQTALAGIGESTGDLSTMVLIEDGRAYHRSTAALRIARRLRFPWPLLIVFRLAPRFARDAVYSWIARNRYRWFGKRETCLVPSPELAARLLVRGEREHK